ncbi:PAS domain-containing protein [Rhizobium sp. SORGH_AS 787]|nr:PAS domain-containing protein [Rhizobium sp. SORGH_AS_0787]
METMQRRLVKNLLEGGGFYSWSLATNLLTGDLAFAQIYEIDQDDLAKGIPVESILERIVEEDRPRLAARIHDVILGGTPFVSPYRIYCADGQVKSLLSMGSCARDADGVPSVYSGVVLVEREIGANSGAEGLELHIGAAIDLAKAKKFELTERYLSSALRSLSPGGS